MSIVLDHISRSFRGTRAVDDLSLEITDGEFFVLLGPSGSGKSTLLRIIAWLEPHDHGRIFLHGREVTYVPVQSRDIGFVFQHYALFQHMTVTENIEFGLRVRGVPASERRRRSAELLAIIGLERLGQRRPRQLSGGQQQRVALARALAPHPAVFLLDEPFGALDAQIRIEMRQFLQRIQQELRITTIFVTHDQEEAFQLGDRLGIMRQGRLLELGTPENLYLPPQTAFGAAFLGTANLFTGIRMAQDIVIGEHFFAMLTAVPAESQGTAQVIVRPEDVALAPTAETLSEILLGWGVVVAHRFAGSFERLHLRSSAVEGTLIEAVRTLDETRRLPLGVGDGAWIGLRRLTVLPVIAPVAPLATVVDLV